MNPSTSILELRNYFLTHTDDEIAALQLASTLLARGNSADMIELLYIYSLFPQSADIAIQRTMAYMQYGSFRLAKNSAYEACELDKRPETQVLKSIIDRNMYTERLLKKSTSIFWSLFKCGIGLGYITTLFTLVRKLRRGWKH